MSYVLFLIKFMTMNDYRNSDPFYVVYPFAQQAVTILLDFPFFRKKGFFTRLLRDVLHVTNLKRPGDIFFFNHGCFVCWGFKKKFEDKMLEVMREYSIQPESHIESERRESSERDDGRPDRDREHAGHGWRHRQPEGRGDDGLRRVRNLHLVRKPDGLAGPSGRR